MKKILFWTLAAALALLNSCQRDESMPESKGESTVTITAEIPAKAAAGKTSRAAGDGTQINRCILEIYYEGQLYDRIIEPVANKGASFELRLVASKSYDLVFWADHVADATTEAGLAADLHYATSDLQSVAMQGDFRGNDETRDAFTAAEKITVNGTFTKSVSLKRPFAQLSLTTLDMTTILQEQYRPAGALLTFKSAHTSLNALTGEVGQENPVSYAQYADLADAATGGLTMDYLFAPAAPEQKLTDISMQLYNAQGTLISTNDRLTSIPLQRNYRTKVSGNLMTVGGRIDVTLDPNFGGELSKEIIEVADVSQVQSILDAGGTAIRVTNPASGSTAISIPAAYDAGTIVSLEIPANKEAEVTISQAATSDPSKAAPESLVVNMPTNKDAASYLTIDMPETTVKINGQFYEVEATTADNTLIIGEDAVVLELTVNKGSVRIYGTVQDKITKAAGWTGEIIHCVGSQKELDNALRDALINKIDYDYILIDKPVRGLSGLDSEGNPAVLDKRVVIQADTELSGLKLNPAKGNAVTIAADGVKAVLDNMTIVQTEADLNGGKNCAILASGCNDLSLTVRNSSLIVSKASQRGVNIHSATNANSVCTVTLDNTLIGPSVTRLQSDYTTDTYTEEQRTAFKARTDARALSIGAHAGKTVVNIFNSVCEGMSYVVNIPQIQDAYEVNVDNSTLDGRCAFNIWSKGTAGRINISNSSKLVGRNYFPGPTEVFSTIVLNQDSPTDWGAADNIITVTDSEIHCFNDPQTSTNWQYAAEMRSNGANTLRLKGSTRIVDHSGRLPYAVVIAYPDASTFSADDTVTLSGMAEGATMTSVAQ